MWTRGQAKATADQHLRSTGAVGEDEVVILDASTIERSYGWVFVYQSKRFLETGDIMDALGGNGPIVALRTQETLHPPVRGRRRRPHRRRAPDRKAARAWHREPSGHLDRGVREGARLRVRARMGSLP
jgi:hypothetical protein